MIAVLAANRGVTVKGDRLSAIDPAEDKRVQALIGQAIAPQNPRSGAIRVGASAVLPALVMTAYALPRSSRTLAPAEAAALIAIVDPAAASIGHNAYYREAFGFSARESQLAELLMVGHSIESASINLAIAPSTVRIHLRRLFAKTDTSRQSDLIRLLSRLK